ncbi:MAG: hypothetical protein QOJ11_558 [Frankiales bacterium]|nr:hypothetical protein [Frankiales bacterium]
MTLTTLRQEVEPRIPFAPQPRLVLPRIDATRVSRSPEPLSDAQPRSARAAGRLIGLLEGVRPCR